MTFSANHACRFSIGMRENDHDRIPAKTERRADAEALRRKGRGRRQQPEAGQRRGAKTEAIRTAVAQHPDWGAKRIHEEVNRRGVRVSIQMVYKVLEAVAAADRRQPAEPVNIVEPSASKS